MDRSLQQEGRFYTLGTGDMSTTEAEKKRDEFMRTLNGSQEPDSDGTRPLKLRVHRAAVPAVLPEEVESFYGWHLRRPDSAPHNQRYRR